MLGLDGTLNWMQAVISNPQGVREGTESPAARSILQPNQANEIVTGSKTMSAIERLEIYRYAYYARLLECLREQFPALKFALGDDLFDEFAVGYLQQYPSRSYTLFELGARFPRFLRETRPAEDPGEARQPEWSDFLIELAEWEYLASQIFDGPGLEGKLSFSADLLHNVPEAFLHRTRLECSPSLKLVRFQFPVTDYASAVKREFNPQIPDAAETFVAAIRWRFEVRALTIPRFAFEILGALQSGKTIGEAMTLALQWVDDRTDNFASQLQEWFRVWSQIGAFESVHIPARVSSRSTNRF